MLALQAGPMISKDKDGGIVVSLRLLELIHIGVDGKQRLRGDSFEILP